MGPVKKSRKSHRSPRINEGASTSDGRKSHRSPRINEGASTSDGRRSHRSPRINEGASTSNGVVSPYEALAQENAMFAQVQPEIWIQCDKCGKWRATRQYFEEEEAPHYWDCQMWERDGQIGSCDVPGSTAEPENEQEPFPEGKIVWAKLGKYQPWPGMIESDPELVESKIETAKGITKYNVTFFGLYPSRQWIFESNIKPYEDTDPTNIKGKSLKLAILQANEAIATHFSIRIEKYSLVSLRKKKDENARILDGHLENGWRQSEADEELARLEGDLREAFEEWRKAKIQDDLRKRNMPGFSENGSRKLKIKVLEEAYLAILKKCWPPTDD